MTSEQDYKNPKNKSKSEKKISVTAKIALFKSQKMTKNNDLE